MLLLLFLCQLWLKLPLRWHCWLSEPGLEKTRILFFLNVITVSAELPFCSVRWLISDLPPLFSRLWLIGHFIKDLAKWSPYLSFRRSKTVILRQGRIIKRAATALKNNWRTQHESTAEALGWTSSSLHTQTTMLIQRLERKSSCDSVYHEALFSLGGGVKT